MRVLVIGAGSSGLVTAKTLCSRGHEVSVVDAGAEIGGTFVNKVYRGCRLVSSKHLTCFSDFRALAGADLHETAQAYVEYLQRYAAHFGVLKLLRFLTEVLAVRRTEGGTYVVKLRCAGNEELVEEYDAVAVCSGLHNVPCVPHFKGQESFAGTIMHSSSYKEPGIFAGRRVLIIGVGETAFDLGHAAATCGAKSVAMSTRHGFVSIPHVFGNNLPLDCLIINWATHAWESRWAQRRGLHWWITTKITRTSMFLFTGSSWGYNQWAGKRFNMSWDEGRKHILNKASKCMPLISRREKRKAPWWRRYLYSWLDSGVSHVGIDIDMVHGSVAELQADRVRYETAEGLRDVDADLIMLATGYRQRFPFLAATSDGKPEEGDTDDPLPSDHFIINPNEPHLAYIGFVRPNVGAIPPMAEMQAMWWCMRLEDKLQCKVTELDKDSYKLKGARLCYGVDYGYYMFSLAREIGAFPSLRHWLLRSPRVAIACAFGQAHVPIFRLLGPFADAAAVETCRTELYSVLFLRPTGANVVFAFEALGLGLLNGIAATLESPRGRRVLFAVAAVGAAVCLMRTAAP
eukprot:NODE_3489_length_2028_cov_4.831668.p1 GENE.NODE_3489_length_2028_cov_4.831668~~NODE_3489_length_2028_cov_4.831668.p1  ORF type:complete len:573 (+),score=160.12 NODE_3489_length_2028_cov_4.831668:168-1886(+)